MPRPWLQELRLVRETSEMALGDYERRRENELQEVRLRRVWPGLGRGLLPPLMQ